jgi:hypothetical protein
VRKREIQAVCINQFFATISPEDMGKDKRFSVGLGAPKNLCPEGTAETQWTGSCGATRGSFGRSCGTGGTPNRLSRR